ncbi:type 4a pilus biogenesis protein PilO [Aneurinibacillus terranovensis]|uniref:type 4a pilus biogenesis protein PilO n=1 Tax=Aneurinibacillus terranovensis TaxID=278991 RepID=UPI0004023683|nr:type 4a pilus biogenesis protein PilO [Aneurinibacillus terranovensis]
MGEKERQYVLLGLTLLFALLAAFYYFYVTPLQKKVTEASFQLQQTNMQIKPAESQQKKNDLTPYQEQLSKIAEFLPVKPYTDQLIKDLGKLQTISNIQIENATFNEQKEQKLSELAKKFVSQDDQNQGFAQSGSSSQTKDSKQVTLQALQSYLPGTTVSSIEITLSIKGDYQSIYHFVSEVQNLSRYLRVDGLTFTSNQKDSFVIPKEKDMPATVKLTTYYAPQFAGLLDKLPPVQAEPPSGKWNPMKYPVTEKPKQLSE